jgi:hypothetical protein
VTVALVIVGSVVALGAAAWLGLQFRPRPLAGPGASSELGEAKPPEGLPGTVARHYLVSFGPKPPRIETMVIWGRARMKRDPLPWMPVSFWSEQRIGSRALQRLAVTWFGLPLLRGTDSYIDGRGEMVIGKQRAVGEEIDQGENLFMWAEAALVPTAVSLPGVRWEQLDETSARLLVPFRDTVDEMVFRFDSSTGLIREARAMRFREVGGTKLGWRVGYSRWQQFGRVMFPGRISVTWADKGRPWFVLDVDGVAFNVPVSEELAEPEEGS